MKLTERLREGLKKSGGKCDLFRTRGGGGGGGGGGAGGPPIGGLVSF